MDGKGRWAKKRHLPRLAGHKMGVEAVRKVTRAARAMGIEALTLYAFSSENWRRPEEEVGDLMGLLRHFIKSDLAELAAAAQELARRVRDGEMTIDGIDTGAIESLLETHDLPPLDLLIRTSGEQRLSNFLLWQAAYAELLFVETLWPDFDAETLAEAIAAFGRRQRRFGGL
ncbi:MAG: undecaprenyl diphosphate synthase family protein [Sphingomonas sp.]